MSTVDLARLQFATTTLFHFFFVPITIGMLWLTAIMQTAWRRTGNPQWLRLARFFGKLVLVNVAIGVATGLVQEFQFGMNWSVYSRFVGDLFGAPLAIEGLAAFFLESTFLGIWIFGWNKLRPRVHLATIYLAALGATLSAIFIIAANSWMQHPVGYALDPDTGRAHLTSIGAVFTNPIFLWAIAHTLFASLVAGGCVLLAASCWQLRKGREVDAFRRAATLALVVTFPATGAGQRQRLGLARALLRRGSLLVLDEPTAHLDPASVAVVARTIAERQGAQTIVVMTHDPLLVLDPDRVIELDGGRLSIAGGRR